MRSSACLPGASIPRTSSRRSRAAIRRGWPSRAETRDYARRADALVRAALAEAPIEQPGHPVLDRGEGAYTALEHEAMHQETLLYMWHRLDPSRKQRPAMASALDLAATPPVPHVVRVDAGRATLGAVRGTIPFGWDNEFGREVVEVPAFDIDAHNVTNADWLAFVAAGGYQRQDLWTPEGWAWRVEHQVTHPMFWERAPSDQGGGDAWVWRATVRARPACRSPGRST